MRSAGGDEYVRPWSRQVDRVHSVNGYVVGSAGYRSAQKGQPKSWPVGQAKQLRDLASGPFPPTVACRFDQVARSRVGTHLLGEVLVAAKVGIGGQSTGIEKDQRFQLQH